MVAVALAALIGIAPLEASRTVSIDLSSLDEVTYRRIDGLDLERKALLRFVQEGFGVVGPSAEVDVTVALLPTTTGLAIAVRGQGRILRRELELGHGSIAELHLEIMHKMVEVVRELLGQPRAPLPPSETAGGPAARTALVPSLSPRTRVTVNLEGGVVYRGTADALLRLGLRHGEDRGWILCGEASFSPSRGSAINVIEESIQTGLGYRLDVARGVTAEVSLLLGGLGQYYRVSDASVTHHSGFRLDALATTPVSVSWWSSNHLSLGLQLSPGVASRGYTHDLDAGIAWTRSPFRVEAALFGAWRF